MGKRAFWCHLVRVGGVAAAKMGAAMAMEAMREEEGWAGMGGDALRFDGIRLDAKMLEVATRLQIWR